MSYNGGGGGGSSSPTIPSIEEEYASYFASNPVVASILNTSLNGSFDSFYYELEKVANNGSVGTALNITQNLAHSIYLDKNNLVPWHLSDYNTYELNIILHNYNKTEYLNRSYPYTSWNPYTNKYVYDCGPSITYSFTSSLVGINQAETVYNIIDSLRRYHHHIVGESFSGEGCIGDMEANDNINGCHAASQYLAALSLNLNIPAYYRYNLIESNWFIPQHGSVVWPDIGYIAHGDNIYGNTVLSEIPSRFLIINSSFISSDIIPNQTAPGQHPSQQRYLFDTLYNYPKNLSTSPYSWCLSTANDIGSPVANESEIIAMADSWNCVH